MSIDLDAIESRIATGIYGDDRMSKEERNDAFSALAEIIAEVETLRAEVDLLQREASIRRTLNDGLAAEVDAERAAVVAWLREQRAYGTDELLGQGFAIVCGILSDGIERGEHRREEEG